MKNDIYAEVKDKSGVIVYVGKYHPSFQEQTSELFKEGYPDSFDEYDLKFIRNFLGKWKEKQLDRDCLLAIIEGEFVGACLFEKVEGPQDQWEISYIFTKESFRGKGIGQILVGVQEELLKDNIRTLIAKNPSILPEDVISYPFWQSVGFEYLFTWPYYFRDDLDAIVLGKRNPYYPIGKGIPENSGWELGMADSLTNKRISKNEYQRRLHDVRLASKEKWGLDLIGRENVMIWK